MADMFEYLKWRGDILFSELPPNPVDALIFSTLSYISFDGLVSEDMSSFITLENFAPRFFDCTDCEKKVRVKQDLKLLKEAARTRRFGRVGLTNYRNVLIAQKETQFSAITFFLEDGSAFLTFRGTDTTLTGWKEDFNMSFQESVPAQRLALQYVSEFSQLSGAKMHLGGHSKGGNLAMYAAAKCGPGIQKRIIDVYNHDGPGFTGNLMGSSGYQEMVPKIHTYIPQSSIFGMLLEHEEPYIVIKSKQIGGVMQHDPYSWEVMGKEFIYMEEVTADSKFLNKTLKKWLAGMTNEERDVFIDAVFELLATGDADYINEIMHPKNVYSYLKTLKADDEMRRLLAGELFNLVKAARKE